MLAEGADDRADVADCNIIDALAHSWRERFQRKQSRALTHWTDYSDVESGDVDCHVPFFAEQAWPLDRHWAHTSMHLSIR